MNSPLFAELKAAVERGIALGLIHTAPQPKPPVVKTWTNRNEYHRIWRKRNLEARRAYKREYMRKYRSKSKSLLPTYGHSILS